MTSLPEAPRYRTTGPGTPGAPGPISAASAPGTVDSAAVAGAEDALEAIRKEGLTGRQLRMARRVAQKHGLAVTSDFDAVRQLRARGIDPFRRVNILDLTHGKADAAAPRPALPQVAAQPGQTLPGRAATAQVPSTDVRREAAMDERARELRQMQRDIARRRQRNLVLLGLRLLFFVALPTALAGYYFYRVATPMYATSSEFIIQQAEPPSAAGLGGLFQGTSMATQQDSISVQSYLGSREAMLRLDEDHGFRAHFSDPAIDPLQRLAPDATANDAYGVYGKRVELSYDPTEGLVRMEVSATSPEKSLEFSNALIGYAEEQVDQMTARLRRDQMAGALEAYEDAEAARTEALRELTRIQAAAEVLDPMAENSALMSRITALETQRDTLAIELAGLLDNVRPNAARVNATRARIDRIEAQIALVRSEITEGESGRLSQTEITARLREAEENYQARVLMVQEALSSMEAARQEANRQVRYLSMSVRPIPPDAPTYPRAFSNTAVAFLIFAGLYLMMAMTAAIIREQVSA